MTDRINGVWVAFERDIRSDDVEPLLDAIKCLRGVLAVEPNVANPGDWIAIQRVRSELGSKLWEILYPKKRE